MNMYKKYKDYCKNMQRCLKPRIDYNKEYDILYIWFGGNLKVETTIEIDNNTRFDIDKDGTILAVELDYFSKYLK